MVVFFLFLVQYVVAFDGMVFGDGDVFWQCFVMFAGVVVHPCGVVVVGHRGNLQPNGGRGSFLSRD